MIFPSGPHAENLVSYSWDDITENDYSLSCQDISTWIQRIVEKHNKTLGEISIVFCSDEKLLELNIKFLSHDYYTDILTFHMSEDDQIIAGELYISLERVRENAKSLKEDFLREIHRVIIHGILHMIGYNDHGKEDKIRMRTAEDEALRQLL